MVMSTLEISLLPSPGWNYFAFELRHLACSKNWINVQWALMIVIQWILRPLGSAMPKERGKPRHEPTWYSYAAQ